MKSGKGFSIERKNNRGKFRLIKISRFLFCAKKRLPCSSSFSSFVLLMRSENKCESFIEKCQFSQFIKFLGIRRYISDEIIKCPNLISIRLHKKILSGWETFPAFEWCNLLIKYKSEGNVNSIIIIGSNFFFLMIAVTSYFLLAELKQLDKNTKPSSRFDIIHLP